MTLEGLDVSHWQSVTPPLAGFAFGFAKVSEGTVSDDRYGEHMAKFGAAGIVTGGYCFGRDDVTIAAQASYFVNHAVGAQILALDNEGNHILSLSEARLFIATVRANDPLKRAILLYQSASKFPFAAGQDADWIADYRAGHPHTRPGTFWQYTSTPYDKDRFNGSLAELRALAHLPIAPDTGTGAPDMTPLPITDKTPHYVDIAAPATFYNLDGTVQSEGHTGQVNAYSPFIAMNGTSTFYAIYADATPNARLILTKPSAVRPVSTTDTTHLVTVAVDGVTKAKVTV